MGGVGVGRLGGKGGSAKDAKEAKDVPLAGGFFPAAGGGGGKKGERGGGEGKCGWLHKWPRLDFHLLRLQVPHASVYLSSCRF